MRLRDVGCVLCWFLKRWGRFFCVPGLLGLGVGCASLCVLFFGVSLSLFPLVREVCLCLPSRIVFLLSDLPFLLFNTLVQAFLSCLFSAIGGVILTFAFLRLPDGFARTVAMFSLYCLVSIPIVILALLVIFLKGQFSLFSDGFLYNLGGIIFVHALANIPLSTLVILPHLERISTSTWRTAQHLGFSRWNQFLIVEWPVLQSILPRVMWCVFCLCMRSCVVVLLLGGTFYSQTLETALYASVHYDFDPVSSAVLTFFYIFISIACWFVVAPFLKETPPLNFTLRMTDQNVLKRKADRRLCSTLVLVVYAFILLLLLGTMIFEGKEKLLSLMEFPSFLRAIMESLLLGVIGGGGATVVVSVLLFGQTCLRYRSFPLLCG